MQLAECILGSRVESTYVHVVVVAIDVVDVVDVAVDVVVDVLVGLLVVRRLAYTQRRAYAAHRFVEIQLCADRRVDSNKKRRREF